MGQVVRLASEGVRSAGHYRNVTVSCAVYNDLCLVEGASVGTGGHNTRDPSCRLFIAGRGHIQLPDPLAALIVETQRRQPTVLVSLGSPYLLNQLDEFEGSYLLAWADFKATERATARALSGQRAITGRLPITLSDQYPRGFGIT